MLYKGFVFAGRPVTLLFKAQNAVYADLERKQILSSRQHRSLYKTGMQISVVWLQGGEGSASFSESTAVPDRFCINFGALHRRAKPKGSICLLYKSADTAFRLCRAM